MAADFSGLYDGRTFLMSHIVSLDYLWNEVRVKGGAYGTGLKAVANGSVFAYSFRDPNAKASVETYYKIADYLRTFANSDRSLVGFIIGAMSSASPLLTPCEIASGADGNYIRGISEESRLLLRKQIVGTQKSDFLALADTLESAINDSSFCVVGSKKQVDLFETLDNKFSL